MGKVYRLISFEETVARGLEKVMERRLGWMAERCRLLPKEVFRGRPGQSTEEALLYCIDQIKHQWRQGNVVIGIALDVKAAFPSIIKARLLTNLRVDRLVHGRLLGDFDPGEGGTAIPAELPGGDEVSVA
jgi:hypothetical protein